MARQDRKDRGLFERPRGSGRWWIRYCVDGRDVRRFVGNKTEARNEYDTIKARQRAGDSVVPLRTTIGRLIQLGVADAEANGQKSLKEVRRFAALFGHHWGRKRAVTLTTSDVAAYRAGRRDGQLTTKDPEKRPHQRKTLCVSDSTVNRELSWLRHCYHLGLRHSPPLVSRVPYIPILAERNVRAGFFDLAEFQRLREHLPEHVRVPATIGYYTGMRRGEILGLKWAQIDFGAGVLRLDPHTTKTDEPREVPLIAEVRAALEAWRLTTIEQWPSCPWVCHLRGERVERITTAWKTACRKAGLPGRLFHDFRRSAVRNLVRAGVNQAVAQAISGHKTASVFARYNIVSNKDLAQAGALLERYLEAATSEKRADSGNGTGTKPALEEATPKPALVSV